MNEYKTKCLQILNDITCTNNDDCEEDLTNSECTSNKCVCKENYTLNSVGNQCLQMLYSITCNSNDDCTFEDENSICVSNKCECDVGYKLNDKKTHCENSSSFLTISLYLLLLLF